MPSGPGQREFPQSSLVGSLESSVDAQHAAAVNDCRDGYTVLVNSIDDSIAVSEPFANILVVELRHFATARGNRENFRVSFSIVFTTALAYAGESSDTYRAIDSRSSAARGDHLTR